MKKIDRIETKTVTYFVDGDFEWPIKDLLNWLERIKDREEKEWEDYFYWFNIDDSKLVKYLLKKFVIEKHPISHCYILYSEEARYQLYNEVLKIYNES